MPVVACGKIPVMGKSISQHLLPEYEDFWYTFWNKQSMVLMLLSHPLHPVIWGCRGWAPTSACRSRSSVSEPEWDRNPRLQPASSRRNLQSQLWASAGWRA
jgi:hypothetical protein